MRRKALVGIALLGIPLLGKDEKLTPEQRIALIRGLSAEYATAKTALPRSKNPLKFSSTGEYDKEAWADAGRENGPAARVGDLVQVTKIDINDDTIVLEINRGFKGGRKWYQNIEVGMGGRTSPVGSGQSNAPGGTAIELAFPGRVPPLKPEEIKKLLKPILDFEKRTATESYMDTLPPEIKKAVLEKRALEGMDRDQVVLALGRPVRKVREVKDGVELEDWVYGQPPGKIVFVTFDGDKVVKVKETYAGLGTEAAPLKPPR